jgi:hypothetical protein
MGLILRVKNIGAGHLHDDTLRLIPDASTTGPAVGVQFAAPSLTTWTHENPRFRLLDFAPSGKLLNYHQYPPTPSIAI